MTLFKNRLKKNTPAVIYSMELKMQEAKEKKELAFYYPLTDEEFKIATAHFLSKHHCLVVLDHMTDNVKIYKIYGYSLKE